MELKEGPTSNISSGADWALVAALDLCVMGSSVESRVLKGFIPGQVQPSPDEDYQEQIVSSYSGYVTVSGQYNTASASYGTIFGGEN